MICKESDGIDVLSIDGGSSVSGNVSSSAAAHHQQQQQQQSNGGVLPIGSGAMTNGHNTLQHRRKSQLITFSASSCDIKNSLSHEIIIVNNGGGDSKRGSIIGSSSNSGGNARLSFAEEDILIVTNGCTGAGSASVSGSGTGSAGSAGSGSAHECELDDDVFRRRSLEVDEELFLDDEYGTHIERSNNANDDSGGGSYEDSHAMHSSIGGSNRNSLEKDDDEIDVDVISTDISCYEQLLGSSCNTRNDDDDIATLVGDGENYTKLCKKSNSSSGLKSAAASKTSKNCSTANGGIGSISVGGNGESAGIIYANPFMDDEGIAESGM